MAYIRPGSGTIFQSGARIGLAVNMPGTPFLGNVFLFPYEKMTINGNQITLYDYVGKIFSVFEVNFRHTLTRIKEYYRTYPDDHVAYYYMSIYNKQAEHLMRAIALMEDTGKNRFRDEIRQLKARLDSGNMEAKVGNYPNTSLFDSKDSKDKIRTARKEIDGYNDTIYSFGVFARIIEDRGINPNNFSITVPTPDNEIEIDQEAINELQKSLERQKKEGNNTYWGLGILALIVIIKRRNAKR